jgi:hypothetical protein
MSECLNCLGSTHDADHIFGCPSFTSVKSALFDRTSLDEMLKAKAEIDKVPVAQFAGFKVIENPMLEPMEVLICVGSEYMNLLKAQTTCEPCGRVNGGES